MKEIIKKNKNVYWFSIFYGSLWGISEATLGYALHFLPIYLAGFVMFPVGFYFMYSAYRKTQDIKSLIYVGIIAASINLIGLALPFLPMIKTFVPSAAILFESLLVTAAYLVFKTMKSKLSIKGILFASISWRIGFLLLQFVLTLFAIPSGILDGGITSILNFVLLEGLVNAAILYVFARFERTDKTNVVEKKSIRPLASIGVFVAAVMITLTFSII